MGDAIGQVLPLAVGVALSPVPIIAVVLMLGTPRARSNGPVFVVGWTAGLAVVGTLALLLAAGAGAAGEGEPASWVGVVKLALGVLLVLLAVWQWRQRARDGEEGVLPGWMRTIDGFTAVKSFGMAALLSGANPKNLMLTVGAAAAIAQASISSGQRAGALAVFVAIGTAGPAIPVAIYFAAGRRAAPLLDELKGWLGANNTTIMAVLCLVIGAKLVGDGIAVL